ncbi:MAG: TolC family protein [Bacteroidia bacterium]|nr:TolC family protein [Bacteroidia bacterium]
MKRFLHILQITMLFLSSAIAAFATNEGNAQMSLHDCMSYAISHSTQMRIEAADRNDERWQRRQAILQSFTPSIDAQTYARYDFGRKPDPATNTYSMETTFNNYYSIGAQLTLFDGFKTINNVRMTKIAARMGKSQEQQQLDKICLATLEAYCNVLYYAELSSVLEKQVTTAQSARDKALRQEELGQKGHAEVVHMESELAQKQYQLISARNQYSDAVMTLKDVMFWPAEDDLVVANSLECSDISSFSTADIAESAKAELPSAELALEQVNRAATDLKLAKGEYSPSLYFSAGWGTSYFTYPSKKDQEMDSFSSQLKNNAGEYIQFVLNIPIYDQLRRQTNVRAKKNALIRAEARFDKTMRDIEIEVTKAVNDYHGAQVAFIQAEKMADVQKEAYDLSSKQLEAGLISAIEYQTASQNYLNAMAERMNALLKLKIKISVVRYYQGESYIDQNL